MSKQAIHLVLLAFWMVFAPMAQAEVVNINKANAAAMVENLKGIGPKKAAAIVAYRKSNGAFKSLDDLLNVKGIGEKILKKNKRDLSLSKGVSKAQSKPKAAAKPSTSKAKPAAKPSKTKKKTEAKASTTKKKPATTSKKKKASTSKKDKKKKSSS